jgi:phosphatidylcholine synthase
MGVAAVVSAAAGRPGHAVLWMLAALAVDSVDGSLARRIRVRETMPGVDGRRLDDIVDYENFVVVPVLFLLLTGGLPSNVLGWAAVCAALVASALGFSHRDAKTPDHFFRGFPSYWNVVAIYVWLFEVDATLCAWIVIALAAAVALPFRFLYPTRAPRLRRTSVLLGGVWGVALTIAVIWAEAPWAHSLAVASLGYPAFYLVLSAWLGGFRG